MKLGPGATGAAALLLAGCAYIGDDASNARHPDPDSGAPCTTTEWYADQDGDLHGAGEATSACDAPDGFVAAGDDCDDGAAAVYPEAPEICDEQDNDCDGDVDTEDNDLEGGLVGFVDDDQDGYGGLEVTSCEATVTEGGDCDDSDAAVFPGAVESCNGTDDDCDGDTDEDFVWFVDLDHDGFGDAGSPQVACAQPAGHVADDSDCDDSSGDVYPGAAELCDDLQNDCEGTWGGDAGIVTFFPDGSDWVDFTADFRAGVYGAPAAVDLTDNGELRICDGTWYVDLEVKTDTATITGVHGSAVTVLSGGDETRVVGMLVPGGKLDLTGLTLTEGYACFGAALSTVKVTSCSSSGGGSGAWTYDVEVSLQDVVLTDNRALNGSAAIEMGYGASLVLDGSQITYNDGMGVYLYNTPITCIGSTSTKDGIWGNGGYGVYTTAGTALLVDAVDCDFDADAPNTGGDLLLTTTDGSIPSESLDYGDDETFTCDPSTVSCW